MQTPVSPPRSCQCSHRKQDAGRTVKNCLYNQKLHEQDAARNWMWACPYHGIWPSIDSIMNSRYMAGATWQISGCPWWETPIVDEGLCTHSVGNWTSRCCQLWHFRARIWWLASPGMDANGFKHHRGGYGSVCGRGNRWFSPSEAASNILQDFNMSATMARQGGRVQLEQSDMRLAWNMAKTAKGGFRTLP